VKFYRQSEMRSLPQPKFLIDRYLLEHSIAQMSGPSGVGKTFVYTDWACRLAAGGRKVLVIVGEGFYRYQTRIDAWAVHHGIEVPNNNLIVLPSVPALPDAGQMQALISAIAVFKHGFDIVIVDTFARSMAGYDENDTGDVSAALANLDGFRRAAGDATGLLITHFGWDGNRQRGASSLYGACDTVIYLKKVERKNPQRTTDSDDAMDSLGYLDAEDPPRSRRARLHLEKQRDAPDDIPDVILERTDIDLGYLDADGEPARSCVYLPVKRESKKAKAATNGHANGHGQMATIIDLRPERV